MKVGDTLVPIGKDWTEWEPYGSRLFVIAASNSDGSFLVMWHPNDSSGWMRQWYKKVNGWKVQR